MNPFLILIFIHFVGDFLLQNDTMAINKSKSIHWLTIHVLVYTSVLAIGSFFLFDLTKFFAWFDMIFFVSASACLHWATDFFTSKLTSYLYQKAEKNPKELFLFNSWRHWFFTAVGADQILHYSALFLTYQYLK